MTTRNGKIARLPRNIREQLNHRLSDGEAGGRLVDWLNKLTEVRHLLAEDFDGRDINEQNLSEWRQGGYQDWLKQQDRRCMVRQLAEDAGQLHEDADGLEVSHHLAAVLTVELAESAKALMTTITDPAERWVRLGELLRELARVRREDCRAGRLQIERERRAKERAEEESNNEWRQQHAMSNRLMQRSLLIDLFAKTDIVSQAMAAECAESLLVENGDHRDDSTCQTRQGQSKSN